MWTTTALQRLIPALVFLLAALPPAPQAVAQQQPSTDAWYVMDREGWLRTEDERLVRTAYDLRNGPNLAAVPFEIGDWVGIDLPITNLETFPTLDADNIVYRGYYRPADGAMLLLSLIGSTRGQSFHHSLVCYQWASWPAEDRGTVPVALASGDVVLRFVVGLDPAGPKQTDLHFYLWPNARRAWEDGATQVRVTGIDVQGEEAAVAAARDFARLLIKEARRPDPATTSVPLETAPPVPLPGTTLPAEPPPAPPATEPAPAPETAPAEEAAPAEEPAPAPEAEAESMPAEEIPPEPAP
jgi:hypothetical protein